MNSQSRTFDLDESRFPHPMMPDPMTGQQLSNVSSYQNNTTNDINDIKQVKKEGKE